MNLAVFIKLTVRFDECIKFFHLVSGAGAERRRTFVLQLRITTPHYGHLILQMAVYAL